MRQIAVCSALILSACMSTLAVADLHVPQGFTIQSIANAPAARELAVLPNGDLLVGTLSSNLYLVPKANASDVASARVFASIDDAHAAGIAYSPAKRTIFVGTEHGVYAIPYSSGDRHARDVRKIADVRVGSPPPGSDGDIHRTTSVAFDDRSNTLYAAVGSSCNACVEIDPTRAAIFRMNADGSKMIKRANRIRNAIALAVNPVSGHLWAGDAGQDSLPQLHPYEFVDDVSLHAGIADYGWPDCEEHHAAYRSGADCSNSVAPLVEFPAYTTVIGAAFYPAGGTLQHAFGTKYRGALFVTRHGSWHTPNGCTVAPEVDVIEMHGDAPAHGVDWQNPTTQWQPFVTGYQPGCSAGTRIGRPSGIAVGADGSLYVADDQTGNIYRIRPKANL